MSFKKKITQEVFNIPGWSTERHIVVFESDDWGSIRMPSIEAYKRLMAKGVRFVSYGYDQYDTIASPEDLQALFEACDSVRDKNGRPAIITANCVVANPDFERIRQSKFNEYFYEPITATMSRYYPNTDLISFWKEGFAARVFKPQLHGREHVNAQMWLNSLRANHKGAREAFDEGVFSILVSKDEDPRIKNTTAFKYLSEEEKPFYEKAISEATKLFKELFGYAPKSFIPPSYCWENDIEKALVKEKIETIQGIAMHFEKGKRQFRRIGQKTNAGLINLVRNASWEPTQEQGKDVNGMCLKEIASAFRWKKPATISAHRLNFIGALNKDNRDGNLKLFKDLLSSIKGNWPDVEFMSSDELGELIMKE